MTQLDISNRVSRRSAVDPFRAMDVLAEANRMIAKGLPVISLAVGQPASAVPDIARQAARLLLDHGRIAYTDALGRSDLRSRIARHYADAYRVEVDPARVMVTTGSSAGFNLAFLAAFDAGDRIAIASPGYPAYRNIIRALGLEPVEIEVGPDCRFILSADHLRLVHEAKPVQGVLIASPANPTGTMTPPDELRRLITYADQENIRFISDEIYHGLSYGEAEATALAFSSHPIVVNSFSKYYCMTGWRIGWLILPPELVRATERIAQSLYISAPELSQVAATAVLDAAEELDQVRDGYVRNRDLLARRLPEIGFEDIAPIDGAFYAYARIPDGSEDSVVFCRRILESCHVAMTPGIDFDPRRGEAFIRISYACDNQSLIEALDRLTHTLKA